MRLILNNSEKQIVYSATKCWNAPQRALAEYSFFPLPHAGKLVPLDFEIQGGQDEGATGGSSGIVIKEIKDGSLLDMYNVRVGDYILKVGRLIIMDKETSTNVDSFTQTYWLNSPSLWKPENGG